MELDEDIQGPDDLFLAHILPDSPADLRVRAALSACKDIIAAPGGDNTDIRGADS